MPPPTGSRGAHPEPVERVIDAFARFPGIGRKSAERMTFHLLSSDPREAEALKQAIIDVTEKVCRCSCCYHLADHDPCAICVHPSRDASTVMIVEQSRDILSLEATGLFGGVYHVLDGQIDPLGGVQPSDLNISSLVERVDQPASNCRGTAVKEIILALSPTIEGDSTALYLADQLSGRGLIISRLARGLPAGSQIDYASPAVLADAIECRQPISVT